MASWGFNFRGSSGYVTDAAGDTYVLADMYPTTRGGRTFGFTAGGMTGLDRDSSLNPRLAGINYKLNDGSQINFQADLLTSGPKRIRIALGDAGGTQGYQYIQVKDGSTTLFTIDDTNGTAEDNFDDATGTNRTSANWPTDNVAVEYPFLSTTLNVVIGSPAAQSGSTTIAHIFIEDAVTAVERSASLGASATIAVSSQFFTVFERSSSVGGSGAVSAAGVAFSVVESAASLSATASIQVSGTRVVDRAVLVSTTATIETAAEFFSVFQSAAQVATTAAITSVGQRALQRAAVLDGNAQISVASEFFTVLERAASLVSATAVTVTHQRELMRAVTVGAVADITARGEGAAEELERNVSINTTAGINVTGHAIVERSVSCGVSASIAVAGLSFSILQGAAQIEASGFVQVSALTVRERSVLFGAAGTVSVAGVGTWLSGYQRSAALSAIGNISVSGFRVAIVLHPTNVNLLNDGQLSAVITNGTNNVSINSGDTEARLNG